MKLGFALPIVGSAVSSAAGLSAFCRGLEDLGYEPGTSADSLAGKLNGYADAGTDEAFVDAFAAFPSLDQMLDFASQVIARTSRQ
jgi:hypothetical protein